MPQGQFSNPLLACLGNVCIGLGHSPLHSTVALTILWQAQQGVDVRKYDLIQGIHRARYTA